MRNLFLIILVHLCLIVHSQVIRNVSGKVVSSETGYPVEGVTIQLANTNKTTLTDKSGGFTLEYTSGQILTITHAEFKTQTISLDSLKKDFIEIYLHPISKFLTNVIVNTGYQKIDPGKTTGSFVVIDSILIERSTGQDILSRLDGVVPSLYFDKRKNSIAPLQIRGISTLGNASTKPLIILNNFPFEGDINDINPADILSVNILRDAAAYAIWGARAGNGVIVITTQEGKFNQRPRVSFQSTVTITPKPDLYKINTFTPQDYITVEKFLFKNGFYDGLSYPWNFQPYSPVVDILFQEQNGDMTSDEAARQIETISQHDIRSDFEKHIYRPEITQQYTMSLSGGNSKETHYVSLGYDKNLSDMRGNKNHRITAMISNSFKPNKQFEINVDLLLTHRYRQNNNTLDYGNVLIPGTSNFIYPYSRLADKSGNPLVIDAYFRKSFIDTAGGGKLLDWKYRPLEEISFTDNLTKTTSVNSSVGMTYHFTSYLNAQIKYQHQDDKSDNKNLRSSQSFEVRNWVNLFSQITNGVVYSPFPIGGILDSKFMTGSADNLRAQVNFNKQINSLGSLSVTAGGEIRTSHNTTSEDRVYGYTDNLNVAQVDYVNLYPTYNEIYGELNIPMARGLGSTTDHYVSAFAIANYNYGQLFSISGSYRYDASNLFGVKTNRKGIPLWSVGGAINLSSVKSYHISWLPYLRLRLTYGYGGNVSHSIAAITTLSFSPGIYQSVTGLPYATINNYPNPDLQWEKVATTNIGIDFGADGKRITGSIDIFKKMSYEVLYAKDMDPTLGVNWITTNSANLRGLGFDLSLNSINLRSTHLNWNTNLNLSYIKTKITKLLYSGTSTIGFVSDGLFLLPIEGYEPFQIVSFQWAGLDKAGNPVGKLKNELSTDYDLLTRVPLDQQVISGSAVPHFFGNLRNNIGIYKLNISFNITFKLGYYIRKPTLDYYDLFYRGTGTKEFVNRWQKEGDELKTNVPSMLYPYDSKRNKFYQGAVVNVLKGDNIRLQDVRISYSLFSSGKSFLKSFDVYAMISNINLVLWKANKQNIDPEFPSGKPGRSIFSLGFKTNF